jgi:hypothetical protein
MIDVILLVLHELAHLAAPPDEWHGPRWRQLYLDAVESFTGIRPAEPTPSGGRRRIIRSDTDRVVQRALERWAGFRSEIKTTSAERTTGGIQMDLVAIDEHRDLAELEKGP